MRTIETKVYTFNELSAEVQKKVLEKNRDINVDYGWWAFTIEDIKAILSFFGFRDIDICFSGFYSQGDGACFIGKYSYNPEWKKELSEYAPHAKEWMEFGESLQAANDTVFAKMNARIDAEITKSNHHYCHENTVSFNVYSSEDMYAEIPGECEVEYAAVCKNIMRRIYSILQGEYEYLTSDEVVKEHIIANEYEFTEEGRLV